MLKYMNIASEDNNRATSIYSCQNRVELDRCTLEELRLYYEKLYEDRKLANGAEKKKHNKHKNNKRLSVGLKIIYCCASLFLITFIHYQEKLFT